MKFFGELLILLLLLLINGRVFFPKKGRQDPLVEVVPLCTVLSILSIVAWGFDIFNGVILILSLLVFFTNFHALFRYSSRLYVDHYSSLMKAGAVFTTLLTVLTIVLIVYFRPVVPNPKEERIEPRIEKYTGSIRSGFEKASNFNVIDSTVYEYSDKETDKTYKAVLFLPDRRADVINYEPFLQKLAETGCTVLTADFYTDDYKYLHNSGDSKIFRRFFMILSSLIDNQKFMSQREFYTYNMSLEAEALLKFAREKYNDECKYYIVSDVMGKTAAEDLYKMNPDLITGVFALDSIPEYKTAGYGCVEQTNPLLAKYLLTERDVHLNTAKILAKKTSEAAKKSWGVKVK